MADACDWLSKADDCLRNWFGGCPPEYADDSTENVFLFNACPLSVSFICPFICDPLSDFIRLYPMLIKLLFNVRVSSKLSNFREERGNPNVLRYDNFHFLLISSALRVCRRVTRRHRE